MALVRLDALLPLILPLVPGCPHMTALLHARAAAIEFCERTRCWRHAATVTVTNTESAMVAPDAAAIHEIEQASTDGRPLTPTQFTDLALWGSIAGQPEYITQTNAGSIAVFPNEGDVEVSLTLFLKPRLDSERGTDALDPLHDRYDMVPDWMISQYGDALADGALSRILLIPGQTWTDPARAGFHLTRFERAADSKFRSNVRGQQRAKLRVKPQWM